MNEQVFGVIFGSAMLVLGGLLLVATRKDIWATLELRSWQFDPLRRWYKRKFPRFDRMLLSVARVVLRVIAVIMTLWGAGFLMTAAIPQG